MWPKITQKPERSFNSKYTYIKHFLFRHVKLINFWKTKLSNPNIGQTIESSLLKANQNFTFPNWEHLTLNKLYKHVITLNLALKQHFSWFQLSSVHLIDVYLIRYYFYEIVVFVAFFQWIQIRFKILKIWEDIHRLAQELKV